MIKRHLFVFTLGGIFLVISALMYFVHYLAFHDIHHILIYLVGDLAFLPLEVLLVGLIIERIVARRETQAKLQKLNMVVGAFFIESGNHLLRDLLTHFHDKEEIAAHLSVAASWTKRDFQRACHSASHVTLSVDFQDLDLSQFRDYLSSKRDFFLRLLENPSLLEHDRFTNLLWAVTHLDEELEARASLTALPEKDMEHIAGDIRRLYEHLATQWLEYVEHLKSNYPYLFSLVLRTHPFQRDPSPVVS